MATGIYGTIKSASINLNDVEIFYTFQSTYTDTPELNTLNPLEVLSKIDNPNNTGEILGGLYNMSLSPSIFNTKGIYNFLIRPKEIRTTILDCGILASRPDVRGVIVDLSNIPSADLERFENGNAIGYRIEYLDTNPNATEKKLLDFHRIVTSNFKVEPVSENLTNTSEKNIKYRINENSSLVFLTVTPNSASSSNPNLLPFIGLPNQQIIIYPTSFDPYSFTINAVENDFDTLALGIFGDQTLSVQDGIRTYYNEDGDIFKQFDEYVIKDDTGENELFEVKTEKDTIDFDKNLDDITNA